MALPASTRKDRSGGVVAHPLIVIAIERAVAMAVILAIMRR